MLTWFGQLSLMAVFYLRERSTREHLPGNSRYKLECFHEDMLIPCSLGIKGQTDVRMGDMLDLELG